VSLPHLLLVDDSAAIVEYERAALSAHYATSAASDGAEALEKAREIRPAAILLDLSMPRMDGEQALSRLKADPQLREIPVIVVSSERARGERCVSAGAAAFLPKPVRADELRALVERVLAEDARRRREGKVSLLPVRVGPYELGVPLEAVRTVAMIPLTSPLPAGPFYLREMFELRGEPVCLLDLAARLGVPNSAPLLDRKVVVVETGEAPLALSVDQVRDPEEFERDDVFAPPRAGDDDPWRGTVRAMVRTGSGAMPVLDPAALVSGRRLRRLPAAVRGTTGLAAG
jgi:CheY-like chemotaxis protein/chemotaxis signal transduction protein